MFEKLKLKIISKNRFVFKNMSKKYYCDLHNM